MIEHSIYYLGNTYIHLHPALASEQDSVREALRSNEEKVIDQIENAQLQGVIQRDARGKTVITLRLSNHGIQLVDSLSRHTIDRMPLLSVVFSVAYDDGFGRYNCAIVEKSRTTDHSYQCHLLQSESLRAAEQLCKDITELFNAVQADSDFETE